MLMTLCLTVFVDLISAVAMGLIVAGLANAGQLENLELDSVVSVPLLDQMFLYEGEEVEGSDPFEARVGMVALRGSFTVASSRKLVWTISLDIKDHEVVIFDFSGATYIDDSAAMVIKKLIDVATDEETETIVIGLSGDVAHTLRCARRPEGGAAGAHRRKPGRGARDREASTGRLRRRVRIEMDKGFLT